MKSTRRSFIKDSTAVTAGLAAGSHIAFAQSPATAAANAAQDAATATNETPVGVRRGDMIYRQLGRTGEEVSLIGLGGAHIGGQRDEQDSIRLIRSAVDRGITFMDNCWDYSGGASEVRMGKALQDGYRDKVFLMTKIDGRDKKTATQQLDESLRRLQTDHLDLLQIHEIIRLEGPDRVFAAEGAIEAMKEAQQAGKARYIGFTGHKDPIVHLRMLEIAAQHNYHFDAVQMPINVLDAQFRSFEREVLPVLLREGIAPLAMKAFGGSAIIRHFQEAGTVTPIELLHYAMSQPVSVVITGMDRMELVDQAMEAVRTFEPMTAEQRDSLLARTREAALTGRYERFKTSDRFDGTARNPHWLG